MAGLSESWDDWTTRCSGTELDRACARTLADEVAIDFPAMHDLVPRMLSGFRDVLAPAPHVAHVSVSWWQAEAGARLPVRVPLQRTCSHCGGRGESWANPCRPCDGSGVATEHHPLTVTLPAGVADGARFAFSLSHPRGRRADVEVLVAVR